MNRRFRVLIVVAAVALTGCTNGADPDEATSSTSTSATSTTPEDSVDTSPSPSTSSTASESPDLDPAPQEAAQTLIKARTLYSKIAEEEGPIEEIYTVARDQAARQWTGNLAMYRSKGWTSEGTMKVEILDVEKVAGENEYLVNACMDASGITTTDKNGDPVGDPDAPERVTGEYRVKDFGKDGMFVVEEGEEAEPC